MSGPRIIIFARRPRAGEVKTRLAAGVGDAEALDAYNALLRGVIDRLSTGDWIVHLSVTPDAAAGDAGAWPRPTTREPQGVGDLGERIARALSRAAPDAPVLVVGSDVPELGAPEAAAAFAGLSDADLVLGPAPDGGFWAIGASRALPAELLDGVRWSTAEARQDTVKRAQAAGLRVRVIDLWLEDVDTVEDWRRWRAGQPLQEAPPITQNLAQCGWLSGTGPEAPASVGPRSKPSA